MNEQTLKDFIATAQKYNYDWNTVFGKFPELKGYNQQVLKDYVATAEKHNYNYGVVNAKFPELKIGGQPLKKKDFTASASKLEKPTSVSSTKQNPPNDIVKPQAKKGYQTINNQTFKGEGEIFTDYPGKEGKAYRFNNGQWYEYTTTEQGKKAPQTQTKVLAGGGSAAVPTGGYSNRDFSKDVIVLNSPIKDPMRVQALNKQYKKWGTTENGVFLGFPGKEQNEYKVVNGQWQRRTPENKTWVNVTNQDSVTALNNHFNKEVKLAKAPEKIDKLKEDNMYSKSFDDNLKSINSSLISGTEEDAVEVLRKKFPAENGWKFEESAGIGGAGFLDVDKVKVTAPNGQEQTFTLDNWTWDDDKRNANNMIGWMQQNNLSPSEKEVFDRYNQATEAPKDEMKIIPGGGTLRVPEPMEFRGDAKQARAEWMPIKSQKVKEIQAMYSKYTADGRNVDKYTAEKAQAALGALADDKETILQVNKYQDDVKYNAESYKKKYEEAKVYLTDLNKKYALGEITKEEFDAEAKVKQKELLVQEEEINNQIKVSDHLTKSANQAVAENYIVQQAKGSFGGGVTLSFIKGVASPVRLIEGALGVKTDSASWHKQVTDAIAPIWDYETSLEYLRSEERPDLYKTAFSVAESLGAMVPLAASGGATLLGEGLVARGAMTAAAFYPMSYYEMKDELEKIDIPEADKIAMSSIYGVVSSALESIGMEYAMGKISGPASTMIKRGILKNVLSKELPKDAPKEYIDALVRNETKAYLANIAANTAGSMLVEGGTEGIQSMAGAGIKELYDIGKGTKFFNNKGFGDVVNGALYESYLGALGGGMVHSIYTSADAYKRNRALNSKELGLLMMAAKTNGMSETLMTNLKADMLSGRIKKTEAQDIVNNFDSVRGNMNQMPENLTPEAQSVSLSLMMERDKLNKQIQGKDPNLVKPQADRVSEINTRLQEIATENAVQEQSTGEVPVQSGAGTSQQMEERVPESETEGTAGEVIGQETQVEQTQAELDEKKKNAIEEEKTSITNRISQLQDEISNTSRLKPFERSAKKSALKEQTKLLELLESDPKQYARNQLQENSEQDADGNLLYPDLYNASNKLLDTLLQEPLTINENSVENADGTVSRAPISELSGETGQLLTDETGNLFDVNEPAQPFEFTQETIPAQLQGVEPVSSSEVTVGRGRNRTTTTKVVFSGQQIIDAGIGRLASEEQAVPEVGTTEATIDIAPELETQLTGIYEAQQSGKALTPKQQKVVDDNKDAYNQVVSSRTLADEVSALDQLIGGTTEGPSFQLQEEDKSNKEKSKERKAKLKEQAIAAMERIQPEIADEAFDSQEPSSGTVSADITENQELTDGIPRRSIRSYIGKKMNILMADLLKVDMDGGIKKMGGAFFPLIPGLRGKIAWASITKDAAMTIVRGAIKSQISMVYNMNPEAMMSNKVFLESVMDRISKLSDANQVFEQMMDRIQKLSFGDNTSAVHKAAREAKNINEFKKNFGELNVDAKAAIMKSILPEEGTDYSESKIEVFKTLSKDGITKESMLSENAEQFASDLPMGALTMALNIVDENGNRPTAETAESFVISKEEAIAMGLPIHENYPFYIKGNVDAILTETAPFWDVLKDFKRSVDAKIANLIQKKDVYIVEREVTDKKGNKKNVDVTVKVYNNPNGTRTIEVFRDTQAKGEGQKTVIDKLEKEDTDKFIKKNVGKIKDYKKGGLYTAKEARQSTARSASMKAGSVYEITEPAQSKYKQFIDRLSKAFPTVEVVTSQEEFDAMIDEIRENNKVGAKILLKKDQSVYGAVYNGKLYLNPNLENYNTPIHEFGHIWLNVAKTMKPELYKKGIELIKGSEYLEQVRNSPEYNRIVKLMTAQGFSKEEIEEYLENEALATAIGDKGESFVSAATKRSFNNWLTEVFEFVKKLTGISEVTAEELQDMSLDEFVQGVVVDIMSENQQFKDAEIESFGSQLQLMTGPSGLSMMDIIQMGRSYGFSDAAIKQVLIDQGFKVSDIKPAMVVQLNLVDAVPAEFANVEGGAVQGAKLFGEVTQELENYARGITTTTRAPRMTAKQRAQRIAELRKQNPTLTEISDSELLKRFPQQRQAATKTTVKPTMGEVRQKAIELLQANAIFKAQTESVQMQLIVALDKTLNTRSNASVQKQISAIKNNIKQRKIGQKELQDAKTALRSLISRVLPVSKEYSQAQINKILTIIAKSTQDTIMKDTDKVLALVDAQRGKMKMGVIKAMYELASKKSKPAMTATGKRRSGGLDAAGQSQFVAIKTILNAAIKGNTPFLEAVSNELESAVSDGRMAVALTKQLNGEKLTKRESDLLNKANAYDMFSGIMSMELENVQDLFKYVKGARTESIMNLQSNRAQRATKFAELNKEASEQMQTLYPSLFIEETNEEGETVLRPKNESEINNDSKSIYNEIRSSKMFSGLKKLVKNWKFTSVPKIKSFFQNYYYHLGTLANTLDNKSKGMTFFTDNVYRPLNRMDENYKRGLEAQMKKLNEIAKSIPGIKEGYKEIQKIVWSKGQHNLVLNGVQTFLSSGQLFRIYALSKNEIQREILRKQGVTESVLNEIETFLGPQAIEFADKTVDYLSNDYYESVNDVYSTVNDINLGYVDNYFPTKKVQKAEPQVLESTDFYGIFNAETAPALQERTDTTGKILLQLDFFDVLEQHFDSMERYKTHAEGVKNLNAIFQNGDVSVFLLATNLSNAVRNAINMAVTPNFGTSYQRTWMDSALAKYTGFALAFKAIQIPKQATSYIQSFDKYNYFTKDSKVPAGVKGGVELLMFMADSALFIKNLRSEVADMYNMSANVRDRISKGIDGDVYGLESGARFFTPLDKQTNLWARARRALKSIGAAPTVIGDVIGVMGYKVAYNRDIKNGMSQEDALEKFNDYNATLQTRRSTERSAIQNNRNFMIKAFNMFGSTTILQMNNVAQAYKNIMESFAAKKIPSRNDVRMLYLNLGLANAMFVLMSNIARMIKGDDDDREEVLKEMGKAMIGINLIEQIPLFGTAFEEALNYIEGNKKPISEVINPFRSAWIKAKPGIDGGDVTKALRPIVEMALGAQFDPIIALHNAYSQGEFADEDIYDIIGISKSYRPTPNKLREELEKEGFDKEYIDEAVQQDKLDKRLTSAETKMTKESNKLYEELSNGDITEEEYNDSMDDISDEYDEELESIREEFEGD